jgi:hypothetical protein
MNLVEVDRALRSLRATPAAAAAFEKYLKSGSGRTFAQRYFR